MRVRRASTAIPVPTIHEVRAGGTEIVMERIDGPMMMRRDAAPAVDACGRYARMLADLHDRLHVIPAPDWLRAGPDDGDRLVHLDLHPLNVIMHPRRGPVVIDWTNAARGDALIDVAVTLRAADVSAHARPALRHASRQRRSARRSRARSSARYRGRALDERIARRGRAEDARREHGGRRGRGDASDSQRGMRAAARRERERDAVGTGMTGPPGPVIPCTTLRAWSQPFPAAGRRGVLPASARRTVDPRAGGQPSTVRLRSRR